MPHSMRPTEHVIEHLAEYSTGQGAGALLLNQSGDIIQGFSDDVNLTKNLRELC